MSKSGNKEDDFRPYLYVTEDFGATWSPISRTLPEEPIHIVWEDRRNRDLLFVGTGGGLFASLTRGQRWTRINNNIPNVPILDLAVHPREADLIVAAFGRGVYVANIAPLQELNETVLAKESHFFEIKPAVQRITWSFGSNDRLFSQRYLITPNPENGMAIRYYMKNAHEGGANIVISNVRGSEVARLKGAAAAGINAVVWNMHAPADPASPGRGGGRGRPPGYSPELWVPLGDYVVTIEAGGQKMTQHARIVRTQGWSLGPLPQTIR